MIKNKINCLIVLGMHRSGTSVLGGCLNLLGSDIGKNSMAPAQSGEEGFFEVGDLNLVHDILLRDLGCKWDMVGNLPVDWLKSEAANRARKSIQSILERHFSPDRFCVLHDPRICRFMPLWSSLLEEMGFAPGIILNLRHPLEVASSMAEKDGFGLRKSLMLWMSYYRDAFSVCGDRPNLIVNYDQLLADPVSTLAFIRESFGVDYPFSLEKSYSKILDFVRPEMKHHYSGQFENKGEFDFAHFIHLYEQICRFSAKRVSRLSGEAGNKTEMITCDQDLLPSPLRDISSMDSFKDASGSNREKSVLSAGYFFNDALSLVGDHERVVHSLKMKKERKLLDSAKPGRSLFAQALFPQDGEVVFTEEYSEKILLAPGEWQEIVVETPDSILVREKGACLIPLNTRGMVHISSFTLENSASGETVFKVEKPGDFAKFRIMGGCFSLPDDDGLTLFVFNHRPEMISPPIPDLPDCPLKMRIWIKPRTDQGEVEKLWIREREVKEELESTRDRLGAELSEVRKELESAVSGMDRERGVKEEVEATRDRLDAELSGVREELKTALDGMDRERGVKEELESTRDRLDAELSGVREELKTALDGMDRER